MSTPTVSADEARWLDDHARSLARIAAGAAHPDGGFGWLDPQNRVVVDRPVETWITCRMTHVLALEVARGREELRPALDVGHAALTGRLRDAEHGGWFPAVGAPGLPTDKVAYAHAFVVLAAASLTAVGHPGGRALLDEALAVADEHFWDDAERMSVEQWDAPWRVLEDYRGVNANMHTVEAMLAAGEVTGDRRWTDRAVDVVTHVVHGFARENDWRLPEHFDSTWTPLPDYNRDRPADQFRPYGVTVGHLLEWSRLTLNARAALVARGEEPPAWMLDDARAIYRAAVDRGWAVDGADGFVYTTGWDDEPIVRERLHWVVCEAIAAAWTLHEVTGEQAFRDDHDRYWAYAREHLLDAEHGGWVHELSPQNGPSETVWWGKPDVYHAYQATLVPLLPGLVSFAGAVGR